MKLFVFTCTSKNHTVLQIIMNPLLQIDNIKVKF